MRYAIKKWNNFFSNLDSVGAKNYSRLFITSDHAGWSLDADARHLQRFCSDLNIKSYLGEPWSGKKQCIHYCSHFSLLDERVFNSNHHISTDYFHGKPHQGDEFRKLFESLKKNHQKISRIRVSCQEMKQTVLESGISPEKVHLIPIGVDTDVLSPVSNEQKSEIRKKLKIPHNAFVVGSFQKDGSGWGEGMEPKWVKAPDVFLKVMEEVQSKIPELYVLLLGPARGYVKAGLKKLGIPFMHDFFKNPNDVVPFYHTLNAYLVTSREEGGPKAILESMACGIPIISTKVGQATDLIQDGINGFLCEVDQMNELSEKLMHVYRSSNEKWIKNGLQTAIQNNFKNQKKLWKEFFLNYVESH